MNTRVSVAIAALAFVVGIAVGVGGSRSSLFARTTFSPSSVTQQGSEIRATTQRSLLGELVANSDGFVLAGTGDYQYRHSLLVTATALHDDYMSAKPSHGAEFFLPCSAIYRVDREEPGNVTVPVTYTTANPRLKVRGD